MNNVVELYPKKNEVAAQAATPLVVIVPGLALKTILESEQLAPEEKYKLVNRLLDVCKQVQQNETE